MSYLVRANPDLAELIAQVTGPAPRSGGVASFLGLVRDRHQGKTVLGIEYSAYEPMAEAICETIVGEARSRWPVRVALQHRLGGLRVGDTAVAVVAAGEHRDEAFAA